MYARSSAPHTNPGRSILKSSTGWTPPTTPVFGPKTTHFCHASEGNHQRHLVHFPPSQALTRTATTFSAASYDRSPIEVTNNDCALPERGCPGRTYVLTDCKTGKAAVRSAEWMEAVAHHGLHRHPSALISAFSHQQDQQIEIYTPSSSSSSSCSTTPTSEPEDLVYTTNDTLRFSSSPVAAVEEDISAPTYQPLFSPPKKQRKSKSCLERYLSLSSDTARGDGCLDGF